MSLDSLTKPYIPTYLHNIIVRKKNTKKKKKNEIETNKTGKSYKLSKNLKLPFRPFSAKGGFARILYAFFIVIV